MKKRLPRRVKKRPRRLRKNPDMDIQRLRRAFLSGDRVAGYRLLQAVSRTGNYSPLLVDGDWLVIEDIFPEVEKYLRWDQERYNDTMEAYLYTGNISGAPLLIDITFNTDELLDNFGYSTQEALLDRIQEGVWHDDNSLLYSSLDISISDDIIGGFVDSNGRQIDDDTIYDLHGAYNDAIVSGTQARMLEELRSTLARALETFGGYNLLPEDVDDDGDISVKGIQKIEVNWGTTTISTYPDLGLMINQVVQGVGWFGSDTGGLSSAPKSHIKYLFHNLSDYWEVYGDIQPQPNYHNTDDFDEDYFKQRVEEINTKGYKWRRNPAKEYYGPRRRNANGLNSVTFSDLRKSSGIPVDEVIMFNNGKRVGKLLVRPDTPLPEFLDITNCPRDMRELHEKFGPGPVYKGWTSEINDPSLRRRGFGLKLYERAIAGLKKRHPEGFYFIPAMCGRDSPHAKTSQDAKRVWSSLGKRYPSSGLCLYIHSCETRKYRQNPDLECIPLEEWDITSWLARHPGYHVMSHSTGRVDPSNFNEVIKDGFRIARGGGGSFSITFIGEDMVDLKTSLRERVSGDRYNLGPYVILAATNLPSKLGIEDDVLQLQREVSLGPMPLKSVNLLEQYPEDHIWRNNAWSMPGRFLLALYDGVNDTICLNPIFDGSIETEYGKRLHENWKEYQKLTSRAESLHEPYEPPAPMLSDDDSDWDDF